MKYKHIHSFDMSPKDMIKIQKQLAKEVKLIHFSDEPNLVSGVDLSFQKDEGLAVIVTMDFKKLSVIDVTYAVDKITLPYIPGLLAFRELPIFLKAWEKLQIEPDIVFFDGQGYAHPRRMGIATHASFFIEKPTIGIAKSRLIGEYEEPGKKKGEFTFLYHKGEKIGIVLRTRDNVKPVFVSPGNLVDFNNALDFTYHFATKYKIPEITRKAHLYTQSLKQR
ncbi:endonuclease V [Petrotoga mexicana DSM 14811]|uniref:Endonuclease V n=1 Tax=Petrotoga mexicana DSM 14811 TaxID=1122954 RepID=A0A2K1P672_9BACT|nr:endonuclease V [Petrotoga mexicana]PNR98298.1 endonuclease V [Petrotoga mexicana DSM 14811]